MKISDFHIEGLHIRKRGMVINMDKIRDILNNSKKIAIAGHVRPDGDCIGSSTALYQYLSLYKKELGIEQVDIYLEPYGDQFQLLSGLEGIKCSCAGNEVYDMFIALDCGSKDRLGVVSEIFDLAKTTVNIDHHISNTMFATINHVAEASSTSEIIYTLIDDDKITKEIATSLYVGIIHDTGVFKHPNTTSRTMTIAGKLIDKGIDYSKFINDTFYAKTYKQNLIIGRCLMESILVLDGKVIVSSISQKMMDFYDVTTADLDGVVEKLRVTKGVEVAMFVYETNPSEYKVSMRSTGKVNVSKIAVYFGGGGHVQAAGCTIHGRLNDAINNLTLHIEAQLKEINEV